MPQQDQPTAPLRLRWFLIGFTTCAVLGVLIYNSSELPTPPPREQPVSYTPVDTSTDDASPGTDCTIGNRFIDKDVEYRPPEDCRSVS